MNKIFVYVGTSLFLFFVISISFVVSNISVATSVDAASRGHGSIRNSSRSSKYKGRSTQRSSPKRTTKRKKVAKPGRPSVKPGKRGPAAKGGAMRRMPRNNMRADNRYRHRNDARRDYYRFRTANHLIRLGARLATRPQYSTAVVVAGSTYYYWGGVYYQPSGPQYIIVQPPVGSVVYSVPSSTTVVYAVSTPYYYHGGAYYVETDAAANEPPPLSKQNRVDGSSDYGNSGESPSMVAGDENYEVVAPPHSAVVPYLPEEATEELANGRRYYVYEGTYYQPFSSEGEIIYMVVENPNA